MKRLACTLLLTAWASALSCEDLHPVVAVRNGFDSASGVQVANIRFNGCVWPGVLAPGETTSFQVCLPGAGRVLFDKFDPTSPTLGWQGRRSATVFDLGALRSCTITLGPDEDERDTEAPGSHGH